MKAPPMTKPTNPERIELPNGCYWLETEGKFGYIFNAKGQYITDVIGVTEANNLRLAMQPTPAPSEALREAYTQAMDMLEQFHESYDYVGTGTMDLAEQEKAEDAKRISDIKALAALATPSPAHPDTEAATRMARYLLEQDAENSVNVIGTWALARAYLAQLDGNNPKLDESAPSPAAEGGQENNHG